MESDAHEIKPKHLVLFFGDSTIKNKYEWNKKVSGGVSSFYLEATGIHHQYVHKISSYNTSVTHILWNYGLHALHLEPFRRKSINSLSDYMNQIYECHKILKSHYPNAQIIYKYTNTICDEKFTGKYAKGVNFWKSPQRDITSPLYYLQFTSVGTTCLNAVENILIIQLNMTAIDSFTNGKCNFTEYTDGRHYHTLIPTFMNEFYKTIDFDFNFDNIDIITDKSNSTSTTHNTTFKFNLSIGRY